jgi:rsbT co-antagonist protein RsbR
VPEAETRTRTEGPPDPLPDGSGLTNAEIDARKAFLEFGLADAERLEALGPLVERYADTFVDSLYGHFLAHEETRVFLTSPEIVERLKRTQRAYFLGLTAGDYGREYVADRLRVGAMHERIQLGTSTYLGAYAFYLRAVSNKILDEVKDPARSLKLIESFLKVVFFDIGIAIDTYIAQREKVIHSQQEAIRDLSTPVLRVRDRLLAVPIVGSLSPARADQLTERVLDAVRAHRAEVVIFDITGVPAVDSAVANCLIRTVEAVRLVGAQSILTGVSAQVAATLVRIGVDVAKLNAVGDLEEGLAEAERILGGR